MKMMKWALLGGAAFAVMSTGAQADELSALKAQLEALQSRVTQLEAQPATSMPSGYSLLSIRDGQIETAAITEKAANRIDPDQGFTLSVLPTADVAPVAEISVSGEIRSLLFYVDTDGGDRFGGRPHFNEDGTLDHVSFEDNGFDTITRGRLNVQGKTDTAVGEVGARIRFQANVFDLTDAEVTMHDANAWWQFAPNWRLITGYTDMLAAIQAGVDWDFTFCGISCGGPSDKLDEQMALVFTSGPFTALLGVDDSDDGIFTVDRGDFPAIVGYLMYNADNLFLQGVGVWQKDDVGNSDDWAVGLGARVGLGDMFTLTGAATYSKGYAGYTNDLAVGFDDKIWQASIGAIFNLAESTRFEAGYGYSKRDGTGFLSFGDANANVANVGVYFDPVSQVTLGLQGSWQDIDDDSFDEDTQVWAVTFGTWLRF